MSNFVACSFVSSSIRPHTHSDDSSVMSPVREREREGREGRIGDRMFPSCPSFSRLHFLLTLFWLFLLLSNLIQRRVPCHDVRVHMPADVCCLCVCVCAQSGSVCFDAGAYAYTHAHTHTLYDCDMPHDMPCVT